jgi:hypothetical protein
VRTRSDWAATRKRASHGGLVDLCTSPFADPAPGQLRAPNLDLPRSPRVIEHSSSELGRSRARARASVKRPLLVVGARDMHWRARRDIHRDDRRSRVVFATRTDLTPARLSQPRSIARGRSRSIRLGSSHRDEDEHDDGHACHPPDDEDIAHRSAHDGRLPTPCPGDPVLIPFRSHISSARVIR